MWIQRFGYTFLALAIISLFGYLSSLKNSNVNVDYIVFTWLGISFFILALTFIIIGANLKPISQEGIKRRVVDNILNSYRMKRVGYFLMLLAPVMFLISESSQGEDFITPIFFSFIIAPASLVVGLILVVLGWVNETREKKAQQNQPAKQIYS